MYRTVFAVVLAFAQLSCAFSQSPEATTKAAVANPSQDRDDSGAKADSGSKAMDIPARTVERIFVDNDYKEHKYRVLLPDRYDETESTSYPLVLFLHGAGERGNDNVAPLKHCISEFAKPNRQAEYPCIVIVPQCPENQKWVSVDWAPASGKGTFPDKPSGPMQVAMGIVNEWLAGGRVDKSRVYVGGLSMGGYGTWFAAAQDDNPFAAAFPICGGGDPDWAKRYGKMPIWAFHGSADTAVPVVRSREMIEALNGVKHEPAVKYTEYDGAGHDVWTQTLQRDDLFAWLFSQRK